MSQALAIDGLDFTEIKNNFISYLRSQTVNGVEVYKDYDFTASGISTLLNILSYNTHYIGYYVKMLLNESFLDSIVKRESALSKAKLIGYIPKGKTSAKINLRLSVDVDSSAQPSSRSILIPKGTSFVSANSNLDQRIFYTLEDMFIKNITVVDNETVNYTSDVFTVYEGSLSEWKFLIDYSLDRQRFIIQSKDIDIDTLKVFVNPFGRTDGDEYLQSSDLFEVTSTSKVYYLTTNEDGYYEIFFGNNIFGFFPENQSTVVVNYMNTNGSSGNGAKRFTFNVPQDIPTEYNISNWDDFEILIEEGDLSIGGADQESLESIKFNIPHFFKRQNRIVTELDYRGLLLSEFPNIESINVWGGEKGYYRDYGKIHISIKPYYADKLTGTAKEKIKEKLINKYCVIGMEPVFEDPEFIDVSVDVYAKIDPTKTNKSPGEIEREINDVILEYNRTTLNVFDNSLSDVNMLQNIMSNSAIKSCYTKKSLTKTYQFLYSAGVEHIILIGNPIEQNIYSDYFTYGEDQCYYKDDLDGKLYIYKKTTNQKLLTKNFGYIEYDKGVIHFTFPEFAYMTDSNFGNSGYITFSAIPTNPDIESFLANIIRITKTRVILSLSK